MNEMQAARFLAELGFLEDIFAGLGYPTQLVEKTPAAPYDTLLVKLAPDARGRPVELALAFCPLNQAEAPNILLLQYAIELPFMVQPAKMLEMAVLLSLVNNRLALGHFSLADDDNKLQFRYVQTLPNDCDVTPKMIRGVAELATASLARFATTLEALAAGQITLGQAQQDVEQRNP